MSRSTVRDQDRARRPPSERWTTGSEEETLALGSRLAARLRPDRVLLLEGPMGAGKTVLTRGIAGALGIDPREIQSPTFTLVHHHRGAGGGELVHLDLYRLSPEEVAGLGIDEILAGPGVKVVEWAECLPDPPADALRVVARSRRSGRREFELTAGRDAPVDERSGG
ncbi:MAG TPA: tRNA (adenosine(37)-N6)-threonylcarbamoyltransferase complex ATPase subunit type 1 TsaE [Thermoanaerobaculia bacterium]|nr:tRNA (adenosine(37)-N6)-threonylcarbamoyltransferase complex ATPase subunit type 1 TsaE [Thermoanaerobaculia bacterium]